MTKDQGGGTSKVEAPVLEGSPCDLESVRTKWRHTSPHPQEGESTLRQPISWPWCLGRGCHIPPSIEPPLPMPTDSSSPPTAPLLCQSHPLTQVQAPLGLPP